MFFFTPPQVESSRRLHFLVVDVMVDGFPIGMFSLQKRGGNENLSSSYRCWVFSGRWYIQLLVLKRVEGFLPENAIFFRNWRWFATRHIFFPSMIFFEVIFWGGESKAQRRYRWEEVDGRGWPSWRCFMSVVPPGTTRTSQILVLKYRNSWPHWNIGKQHDKTPPWNSWIFMSILGPPTKKKYYPSHPWCQHCYTRRPGPSPAIPASSSLLHCERWQNSCAKCKRCGGHQPCFAGSCDPKPLWSLMTFHYIYWLVQYGILIMAHYLLHSLHNWAI